MNGHHVLPKNTTAGFSRVLAIVLLLVLLAVVVWFDPTLFQVSGWRHPGTDAGREEAFGITGVAADRQARLVEGVRELLVGLAKNPSVRGSDSAACHAYLSALLRRNPEYTSLGAMKPHGEVVCSAGPIPDGDSLADRPFVRHAIETRDFAIGEYRLDRRAKQAVLSFAYPVLDTAGRVQAVVFAGLDLAWTAGLLVESQLPQGSAIVVVDQDGTILARYPDSPQWVGTSVLNTPIFRTILEQRREGTTEGRGHDGVQRLFGCRLLIRSSGGRETYVVVTIPRLAARQIARLGLVATLAIAAIWIGGDMALRRRVKRLVSATDRLRLGDLSARTGLRHDQGPMGRLALAFDEMAAASETRRTEAEQAELELRKLSSAVEQIAEGVLITDRDGTIEYVNSAFETLTGYSREVAVGSTPGALLKSGQHDQRFYAHLWETILAGKVFRDTIINRKKDKSLYYEEKIITPLRNNRGEITHFVATGRDITERKRAEAAQRRLNETLEQEARRIAHALHDEAGQLLAVVHIALDDCARDLPAVAQERLQEVRGHLDQIEEQLRRLSHELRPTILDNLGLVPALKFLGEGISMRTGLAIAVEGSTEGRLPTSIETALYRVVQEGLTNVTKHAKASGVRIQLQREDRQIRCVILDNGIGFDLPAVLAKEGDRGLGLIGMQERLKALDGALQITSIPGQGTTLLVTIPLGA